MSLPVPFFFLVGLLAVTAFFVGGTLAVFGLVVGEGAPRRRLAWLQTLLFVAVAGLALYAVLLLHDELAPWRRAAPPERSSDWTLVQRDALSLVLVGLAGVFLALTTAFAWVRVGRAAAALRAVVWAPVGVRLVLDAVGVVSSLVEGGLDPEGASVFATRLLRWASVAAALVLASVVVQLFRRFRRPATRTTVPVATTDAAEDGVGPGNGPSPADADAVPPGADVAGPSRGDATSGPGPASGSGSAPGS